MENSISIFIREPWRRASHKVSSAFIGIKLVSDLPTSIEPKVIPIIQITWNGN